jgi:hypothetical protein
VERHCPPLYLLLGGEVLNKHNELGDGLPSPFSTLTKVVSTGVKLPPATLKFVMLDWDDMRFADECQGTACFIYCLFLVDVNTCLISF